MSLDILRCRIVPPAEANAAHYTSEYRGGPPSLFSVVQPTGYLCVQEDRIGRNCLNDEWHHLWKLLGPSEHDCNPALGTGLLKEDGTLTPYGEMHIALTRDDFNSKIRPFIQWEEDMEEGSWFDEDQYNEPWDFIWISW